MLPQRHGLVASLLLVASFILLVAPTALGDTRGIYVKVFPGKELCLAYEAFRDPEGDPVLVTLQHRALDQRLVAVKFTVYEPPSDPSSARGPPINVTDEIDTFGDISNLYFDAAQTGMYTLCFLTPSRQPVMRFEMSITSTNDIVTPPAVDDEAIVVDKTTSMEDYADRLHMLGVCVDTTVTELRMYQFRHVLFDHTTNSLVYMVVGTTAANALLAAGIMWWSEKYLKRFYVKQKAE